MKTKVLVSKVIRNRRLRAQSSTQYHVPHGRRVGSAIIHTMDSGCFVSLSPTSCTVSFAETTYSFDKIHRAFDIFVRGAYNSVVKTEKVSQLVDILNEACKSMPLSLEELQIQIARRGPSFYRAADAYRAMWNDMHSALEVVKTAKS